MSRGWFSHSPLALVRLAWRLFITHVQALSPLRPCTASGTITWRREGNSLYRISSGAFTPKIPSPDASTVASAVIKASLAAVKSVRSSLRNRNCGRSLPRVQWACRLDADRANKARLCGSSLSKRQSECAMSLISAISRSPAAGEGPLRQRLGLDINSRNRRKPLP